MARLSQSLVSLRITGDDLIPAEISRLLCCEPTSSFAKGDVILGKRTGREYVKRFGLWSLQARDCEPENLDAQVSEILSLATKDLRVWEELADRFNIDLFCGLFMEKTNEGAEISSSTLRLLADRKIILGIDIYAPSRDVREDDPCPCESGKTYAECCMPSSVSKSEP